ncbi:hypothetical protein GM3708_2391 [Geminocystis sp. NIES-3708]|uniref:hypothetical protein n=1 Tax=Geminocystis sp. NIES-3708 TaxID=1615909 RepID=UPI0005FCA51B|nr:hypothetical protein [Geminocystis sp. NIES-3708]BAQ61985.1 hypothetical protein GM3708_2391 [Geminocystis sp. NIES-3708]
MGTIREIKGNPGDIWDDLSWIDMNSDEQKLWSILGWNESSWEEDTDPPPSNDKYWADLSTEEKKAAEELGYTIKYWDEE